MVGHMSILEMCIMHSKTAHDVQHHGIGGRAACDCSLLNSKRSLLHTIIAIAKNSILLLCNNAWRAHLEVWGKLDRNSAEDGVLGLSLLFVVGDDVLEGDLLELVNLAHAIQRTQDDLVQVSPIEQAGMLRHHVRHHCVHLHRPTALRQHAKTRYTRTWTGGVLMSLYRTTIW